MMTKNSFKFLAGLLPALVLAGCATPHTHNQPLTAEQIDDIRITEHRDGDDLLSAGLGLAGLVAGPSAISDPGEPTTRELRQRAIQASWLGIADLGARGGYGKEYGHMPQVPGRELSALVRLPEADSPFQILLQVPDSFDAEKRCLVVAPSSGSRGIYGAIALGGAFGLPRGCAVVYTDKGTGSGYFDTADNTGTTPDGRRAKRGEARLEFDPGNTASDDAGIAVKHVHSGDHPEADWGRHVLAAIQLGLDMLNDALPDAPPFEPDNTRIIATGLSNGGGAVLQAAGLDKAGLIDAVVAVEPNVHLAGSGRALYDYVTEAALLMPCALAHPQFDDTPFARAAGAVPPAWAARCQRLHDTGLLDSDGAEQQAEEALSRLNNSGWSDNVIATAATTTAFDVWRSVAAGYASAYLRRGVGNMACGYSYQTVNMQGLPAPVDEGQRQTWWADASGIPPGNGVGLVGGTDASDDPTFTGLLCLRRLWTEDGDDARQLRAAVEELAASLPPQSLPVWVVHGADDALIPSAFTSRPYVDLLKDNGRAPRYWNIPLAQHFDAFLGLPGFGEQHVPLLPYAYYALEAVLDHLTNGTPLPRPDTPQPQARGKHDLSAGQLDLPD
ncbi:MAG TPA: 3-hydroxybutyrate oligomer hydrolase family protein [Wenzhouxiangella sp.]|nr:3-hydroxybutyrate oligomer hydrolase family protein [Wenzhouxiangella sp.]